MADVLKAHAATPVTTADVWEDRLRALNAAVRDVVLAVSDLQYNHGQAVAQMHINRVFGPEKASE